MKAAPMRILIKDKTNAAQTVELFAPNLRRALKQIEQLPICGFLQYQAKKELKAAGELSDFDLGDALLTITTEPEPDQ